MKAEFWSQRPDDTLQLGEAIGLAAGPGLVVGLSGELGTGKTVLTKGIARGLGCPRWERVTSPTFTLHNVYEGRLRLHHLDLYRLERAEDLAAAGLDEVLYGADVCVVEWPDLFLTEFPEDRLLIRLWWQAPGETERTLELSASGASSTAVLREVSARAAALLRREVVDGEL